MRIYFCEWNEKNLMNKHWILMRTMPKEHRVDRIGQASNSVQVHVLYSVLALYLDLYFYHQSNTEQTIAYLAPGIGDIYTSISFSTSIIQCSGMMPRPLSWMVCGLAASLPPTRVCSCNNKKQLPKTSI